MTWWAVYVQLGTDQPQCIKLCFDEHIQNFAIENPKEVIFISDRWIYYTSWTDVASITDLNGKAKPF